MAEISAQLVMQLREKTGAKMMDAKRALVEAEGDINKAIELLREKGQADAAKRTHRAAADGTIAAVQAENGGAAAMVEVNCETDFVAKTDQFCNITNAISNWMLTQSATNASGDDLPAAMQAELKEAISKTGENIQFKRGVKFASADGVVASYLHLGGKIGVLVQIDGANTEAVMNLARDLAMQVAAASPEYLRREDVPTEIIEKEMEIYRNLARNEGKPEQILDKIAQGRLDKFYKENCLLEQTFIKDTDTTIDTLVKNKAKETGADLTVQGFIRYQLGQ